MEFLTCAIRRGRGIFKMSQAQITWRLLHVHFRIVSHVQHRAFVRVLQEQKAAHTSKHVRGGTDCVEHSLHGGATHSDREQLLLPVSFIL